MHVSGIIFVLIAGVWVAYLLPHALRRYDQAARTRSIERFSSAMRVLGRSRAAVAEPPTTKVTADSGEGASAPCDRRAAARKAARRRRRVLLALLAAVAVVSGVVVAQLAPWWSVLVPVGLVFSWLVSCRVQARREADTYWTTGAEREQVRATEQAPAGDEPNDEPTVEIDGAELSQVAVAVQTVDGATLWDPVPVTLPTYVSKPRAPRTIRTIQLGEPSTSTFQPAEQSAEQTALEPVVGEHQQAVNG